MSRYDKLRYEYEELQWLKDVLPTIRNQKAQERVRMTRQRIHGLTDALKDRLEKSISEDWRTLINEDGEGGVDYIIFEDNGESDAEIQEYVDDEVGYAPINSPYDCTGRPSTWDKHWKRTPAGIVVIHRWAIDV